MPVHTPSPAPTAVRCYADLTDALRELFAWCGRPKYASLSHAHGLAPSAISGLIGKRPQSRPTRSATLRFVEACLVHGGMSREDVARDVARWDAVWQRLDAAEPAAPVGAARPEPDERTATGPDSPDRHDGPGRLLRRAPLLLAGASLLVLVFVAGMLWGHGRTSASASSGSAGDARCRSITISPTKDVHFKRTWDRVFSCPNQTDALLRRGPSSDSPVVSRLNRTPSWFVCWTLSDPSDDDSSIWYYTQGDTTSVPQRLHSWGYVAAADVGTVVNPDPRAFRECPTHPDS